MPLPHTKRITDLNGWLEVRDNPLSRVGVFAYLGREINAPEPERIYQVYRPAEELSDPECVASFRLLPFVDEHNFLGAEETGALPAERKGVQGMIGEQVYFEAPYLFGNIKIVSEAAKGLIEAGKIQLSPGYRCRYDFTPGLFEGQPYDAIQRNIRGNHLALVAEGRTGADVAVQDHLTITIDSAELLPMAVATDTPEGGDTLAQIKTLLAQLKPLLESQAEANALLAEVGLASAPAPVPDVAPASDNDPVAETVPPVEDEPAALDQEPELKAADKAILKAIGTLNQRMDRMEKGNQGMDSALLAQIADRDSLAGRLSGFVGTFDHSRMTVQAVAEYGIDKLSIPATKGTERIALDAWLHGRTPVHKNPTVTLDAAGVNLLDTWEK